MANIVVQLADPGIASGIHPGTQYRLTRHAVTLDAGTESGLLGSEMATSVPTWMEQDQFREYCAIWEDYGVDCVLQPMQYISLIDALQDAAMLLKANAFIVKKPDSHFTLWNRFWVCRLHQIMRSTGCQLYLVDMNTRMLDWVPAHSPSADVDYPLTAKLLK